MSTVRPARQDILTEQSSRRRVLVRHWVAAGLAGTLVAGAVVTVATPAHAGVPPKPHTSVAAARLSPAAVAQQVKAAQALGTSLTSSAAGVTAATSRIARLSAQVKTLKAGQSVTSATRITAAFKAKDQRARVIELRKHIQVARNALGLLASDSYIGGAGPLGNLAGSLGTLNAPLPTESTGSPAALHDLVNHRARFLNQLESEQAGQTTTAAEATSASITATAQAEQASKAIPALEAAIAGQQTTIKKLRAGDAAQVAKAADLREILLRSGSSLAIAADRKLARTLSGRDYTLLMNQSLSCGRGSANYANGQWPPSARCPLYAAPDQSLRRAAALTFDAMSLAYQRQTGSALCVTEAYRSYADQVAIKASLPGLAATPGRSKHGLGLAVDFCGGVQSFSGAAHLWMKRNAGHYGWFHPAWAEPSGSLPEPWHWEYAH